MMQGREVGLGALLRLALHIYDAMQRRSRGSECSVWRGGRVRGAGGVGFGLGRTGPSPLSVPHSRNRRLVKEGQVLGGCDNRSP